MNLLSLPLFKRTTTAALTSLTTRACTASLYSRVNSSQAHRQPLHFEILHESSRSRARIGRIHLPRCTIDTPTFVPVATQAAIKGLDIQANSVQATELLFCNTYHLMLMPGEDVVARAGGLHQFTGRNKAIITDSGGFQVFSLQAGELELTGELKAAGGKKRPNLVLSVNEHGVKFRSHIDGGVIHLTPETSVQAQKKLGADIIIPLDELLPYSASFKEVCASLARTHRWQVRSLREHLKSRDQQAMYAVVHGGTDHELRKESLTFLSRLPFDGLAFGGSLGKSRDEMVSMLEKLSPEIPRNLPTHLLGIGDMESIQRTVRFGLDSFDSCYPTRLARHGTALTVTGERKDLRKGKYSLDFTNPLDRNCDCSTCMGYSIGYIRHLVKARESAAGQLLTQHNIRVMDLYMRRLREQIWANQI